MVQSLNEFWEPLDYRGHGSWFVCKVPLVSVVAFIVWLHKALKCPYPHFSHEILCQVDSFQLSKSFDITSNCFTLWGYMDRCDEQAVVDNDKW